MVIACVIAGPPPTGHNSRDSRTEPMVTNCHQMPPPPQTPAPPPSQGGVCVLTKKRHLLDCNETPAPTALKRASGATTMKSLDLAVHDLDSLDTEALRSDLLATGIAGVRLYGPEDPVVVSYASNIDETAMLVRPDGGTAHGSRSMAGITKRWGAATHPKVWDVRLDSRARRVFELLYGTDDVAIGCDAYVCLRNDAVRQSTKVLHTDPEKKFHQQTGGGLKPHIDINPHMESTPGRKGEKRLAHLCPEFPLAVQGQLVLRSVPAGGATLVVAPGEHKHTHEMHFCSDQKRDFAVCTPAGYSYFDGMWRAVDSVERGVLILWASRLPHANKLSDKGVDPERLGLFISWQPRALVPMAEQMQLKRQKWRAITSGGTMITTSTTYLEARGVTVEVTTRTRVAPRWSYSTASTPCASTK